MKTENKKINLIIDSDISNGIDDQFALAYALSSAEKLNVVAITVAPYRVEWKNNLSIRDGLIDSRICGNRIAKMFGIKHTADKPFIYMGSSGFLSEGYDEISPAVEKILQVARESEGKVWICCLGPLTNVAMALREDPKIASKIKVVWMGTDNVLVKRFADLNFRSDKVAFYEVLASKVDLTVFPTFLGRSFVTSKYEFESNIVGNNVTKYLKTILDNYIFNQDVGVNTIYDIGPIAYVLNKSKFTTEKIDANMLVKDKEYMLHNDRKINYVVSVPANSFVWKDFLNTINASKTHYLKPKVFFTSDTHFGHERKVKAKLVPFKSVEEMNSELVRRWNNKVGPEDLVYHIGDFGDYEYIKQLNGRVVLICGNNELKDAGKNFESFRQKLIDMGFVDVIKDGIYLDESVLGRKVYLTHKPTDHAKDCLTLFGHVHSINLLKTFGFNVCVTYHYYAPIDVSTAKRYLTFVANGLDEDAIIE